MRSHEYPPPLMASPPWLCRMQLAVYPAGIGARYERHRDAYPDDGEDDYGTQAWESSSFPHHALLLPSKHGINSPVWPSSCVTPTGAPRKLHPAVQRPTLCIHCDKKNGRGGRSLRYTGVSRSVFHFVEFSTTGDCLAVAVGVQISARFTR